MILMISMWMLKYSWIHVIFTCKTKKGSMFLSTPLTSISTPLPSILVFTPLPSILVFTPLTSIPVLRNNTTLNYLPTHYYKTFKPILPMKIFLHISKIVTIL